MTTHDDSTSGIGPDWRKVIARFQRPSLGRASWQVINSLGSYLLVWILIGFALQVSGWLVVPLIPIAGGLLVRIFIIFHDCGHGSFLRSRWANRYLGRLCGILTFTPFEHWRGEHARHHATAGDLDRRGTGDIWTMTVQEYLEASGWKRFAYRVVRNPLILFVIGPLVLFVVIHRIPAAGAGRDERLSVWITNALLLVKVVSLGWLLGPLPYALIQLSILAIAGASGVWLFYVQHQFESAYWARNDEWDYATAALQGSSYYKLPRLLQWFTGNIGFHHVHHLGPRIPNYYLEACHNAEAMFRDVTPLTLKGSLGSLFLRLWDESEHKLVGFKVLRGMHPR